VIARADRDEPQTTPTERDANVARIVACVNACAGIPTEVLESLKDGALAKRMEERKELLAAAKQAAVYFQAHGPMKAEVPLLLAERALCAAIRRADPSLNADKEPERPTNEPCPYCGRHEDGKWFTPCPSDDCPSHDIPAKPDAEEHEELRLIAENNARLYEQEKAKGKELLETCRKVEVFLRAWAKDPPANRQNRVMCLQGEADYLTAVIAKAEKGA
jgi:hypothetical protein